MIYVVGSGPSGVAAAEALLSRGFEVTMLDPGIGLEPERAEIVDRLSQLPFEAWDLPSVGQLKHGFSAEVGGVAEKLVYGSKFPYRTPGLFDEAGGPPTFAGSFATGGLSNAWGAGVMPLSKEDMEGWPIERAELDPHYWAAADLLGIAAVTDELALHHPLYSDDPVGLPMSRQARAMLASLRTRRAELEVDSIRFGRSRLAVAPRNEHGLGCAACGLCLYGCPYKLIYTAATTVRRLARHPRFRHEPGWIVRRVEERGGAVRIMATSAVDGQERIFEGDKVFLAAGVLPTARIVLESIGWDGPVSLRDSQYFLMPLLQRRNTGQVRHERLMTLAQLFVQIDTSEQIPGGAHLSIYSYNDAYEQVLRHRAGPIYPLLRPFLPSLLGRLVIAQGFLHSAASGSIELRLVRRNGDVRLATRAMAEPRSADAVRAIVRLLRRHARAFDAWPISPLLSIPEPGRGYHAGGSFPMQADPTERFETDTLGRLGPFKDVHIVDASVLPSVPGTSITFTVMANAHRIATLA